MPHPSRLDLRSHARNRAEWPHRSEYLGYAFAHEWIKRTNKLIEFAYQLATEALTTAGNNNIPERRHVFLFCRAAMDQCFVPGPDSFEVDWKKKRPNPDMLGIWDPDKRYPNTAPTLRFLNVNGEYTPAVLPRS